MFNLKSAGLILCIAGIVGCRTYAPPDVEPIPSPFGPEALETPKGTARRGASPSIPNWPSQWVNTWIPLADWAKFNGLNPIKKTANGPKPSYEIEVAEGKLIITPGTQIVRLKGIQIWLSYVVRWMDSQPCVYWLDAQKTLQPLTRLVTGRDSKPFTLVIDPGHGGRDTGALGLEGYGQEETFTLDWALRIQQLATAQGWKVILTRTNDVGVTIEERISVAERAKADLFISLHFNSGGKRRELAGIETYCLTPSGLPSNLVRDGTDSLKDVYPNNLFDDENLGWAVPLHRELIEASGAVDRGIRRARFLGVLRWQNRPAVLLEGGYLTQPDEARKINEASYRQKLAEAVVRALARCL